VTNSKLCILIGLKVASDLEGSLRASMTKVTVSTFYSRLYVCVIAEYIKKC